jgi:hypothetical protein
VDQNLFLLFILVPSTTLTDLTFYKLAKYTIMLTYCMIKHFSYAILLAVIFAF